MAGRASIVGAAATHVGKVRDHNEDAHFLDEDLGMFLVCDGMGGHAAGEVASDLAIQAIRREWGGAAVQEAAERWLERGTPEAKKQLLDAIRAGVVAAHDSILTEAGRDEAKSGMGTTLVGAVIVGGELVFAHAGDSRAYQVRDGISMQLTEDHTLLARLLAAGIDVDISGEGARFRSMLTNALGIGDEVKVSTFVVPLADGDRFLLCSDGVSEYVPEREVGEVLTKQSSPARAAQRLIELALERGGGDNATAVVVRVLEAGETPLPAEQRRKDDAAVNTCALWGKRVTPQQRLRALRIAIPRDHGSGEKLPPHSLGDRVAWILIEGEVKHDGETLGPGALLYPESLLGAREPLPVPGSGALATARSDVRALAIRANDFRELCDDDSELGEALLDSLVAMIARRQPRAAGPEVDPSGRTDPHLPRVPLGDVPEARRPTDPGMAAVDARDAGDGREAGDGRDAGDRAETLSEEPTRPNARLRRPSAESSGAAPAAPRPAAPQVPERPSSPPHVIKRVTPPAASASRRPGPPPAELQPASPPAEVVRRPAAQPPGRPSSPPEGLQPASPPAASSPAPVHSAASGPRTSPPGPGTSKPRLAGASPRPAPGDGHVRGRASEAEPKGAVRALPPKDGAKRPRTSTPAPGGIDAPAPQMPAEAEVETETYLELEADLPPEPGEAGSAPDLGPELSFGRPRRGTLDEEHESVSITIEEGRRVIETTTETSGHTLTVTVTESLGDRDDRPHAITAEDAVEVSGTISIPEDPPPRARRRREGHDD